MNAVGRRPTLLSEIRSDEKESATVRPSLLVEGELAFFVDAVPADEAEGAENGWAGFFVFFVFAVLDGGGAAETAVGLDADDGGVAFEVDPVTPGFAFVAGLEVLFAKCGEDFGDGAGSFGLRKFNEGFHVRVGGKLGG